MHGWLQVDKEGKGATHYVFQATVRRRYEIVSSDLSRTPREGDDIPSGLHDCMHGDFSRRSRDFYEATSDATLAVGRVGPCVVKVLHTPHPFSPRHHYFPRRA
jgi:hypothetical protein